MWGRIAAGCMAATRQRAAVWETASQHSAGCSITANIMPTQTITAASLKPHWDKSGTLLSTTHHATALRGFATAAKPPVVAAEVLGKARKMSAPVGIVAGLFGSLVGVGGGVVIVPMIVSACKTIPQRLVSGTSLAAVLSTAVVSASTFAQSGCVDPTAALIVSPLAMLTAPIGARLTAALNCTALRRTLGIFLICVAPLVPIKAYILAQKEKSGQESGDSAVPVPDTLETSSLPVGAIAAHLEAEAETVVFSLPASILEFFEKQAIAIKAMPLSTTVPLAATGAVAGLASGLLGIGGGTIVTPLIALLMPYSHATVLGTSLLSMVPPSLAALAQHTRMGNVDWRMAAGLAAGTAVGGALGSNIAVQAPPGALEACFAVGMAFLGRKTLQSIR